MFYKGSRYNSVGDHTLVDATGRVVPYKKFRFIPRTEASFQHEFVDGDRLDLMANRFYRDSTRFFRICDANRCIHPDELESEPGRILLVPPSEG